MTCRPEAWGIMFGRIVASLIIMAVPGAAWAAGSADRGGEIVARRCVSCHEAKPSTGDPTLFAIAQRHKTNRTWVRDRLRGPHRGMTGINLDLQEIEDIIAYLDRLDPQ
jgi:mono/diheme cytochrome c family protein